MNNHPQLLTYMNKGGFVHNSISKWLIQYFYKIAYRIFQLFCQNYAQTNHSAF